MRTLLALTILLSPLMSGCDHIPERLAEREVQLKERRAIEQYNEAVPASWTSQDAWVSALATASGLKTPEQIGRAYAAVVIPALAAYQTLLAAIPVASKDLSAIHGATLAAHARLASALGAFSDGLKADNYKARRVALVAAIAAFNAEERDYRSKLEAHFERYGVARLSDPPQRIAKVDMDL